jgi:hypothetical protein
MNYNLAALVVAVVVMAVLAYRHQDWMNKHCVCDGGAKHGSGATARHGASAKHGSGAATKHGSDAKHAVVTSA